MEALLAELAPEFGEGRVFRPNRDVRFSADKSPYKTAMAAMAGDVGYVQLSAKGLGVGSGMWMMAADQLDRYRRAVADDGSGEELVGIVSEARGHGLDVTATTPSRRHPGATPRTIPASSCSATRASSPGGSGRPGPGWAPARPRPGGRLPARGPAPQRLAGAHVGPSELPDDRRR